MEMDNIRLVPMWHPRDCRNVKPDAIRTISSFLEFSRFDTNAYTNRYGFKISSFPLSSLLLIFLGLFPLRIMCKALKIFPNPSVFAFVAPLLRLRLGRHLSGKQLEFLWDFSQFLACDFSGNANSWSYFKGWQTREGLSFELQP